MEQWQLNSLLAASACFTYKNFSMVVVKVVLGTAPIIASIFSPYLKMITVGMLRIPYWVAMEGQSSVLTL
jgi:hypothetical protein